MTIRTRDLRKTYGPVKALDGLNLDVAAGTIFGFLGPNGAGKTTTIRLLTGLAHPTSGHAWVAGEEVDHSRRTAARFGYLPEEPAFYGWMTPIEFLDHVGSIFGLPGNVRKERTHTLLEQVGLAQAAKRKIAGFSRGMRQRLGLAQALVGNPEVLLLDEPVSALDPVGRKEVLEMIHGLHGRCTVFMSTHILADVERICDTVGIIHRGRLLVEAPQAELLARYTIPTYEVEVEPGNRGGLRAWAAALQRCAWLNSIQFNGDTARVVVDDPESARAELLPSLVQAGLPLHRFEAVTPSLEDVFLRLVGQEETK